MRFASVCSGIEAASVAWLPLGWECAWVSEIAPFPCAVLAHHYPEVLNRGDFTKIGADAGGVDLLVGGTPCQSFSVAGRRAGLDDARGVLAFEFLRLAGRLLPRWVVFENVPGLLSSGGGRDFGAFLGDLGRLGYGWTYRVLDAQFFGVAQRRARVFVVGHLGDWRRAAAVLLEPSCLRGDPAPSRETGARVAASLTRGADSGGEGGYAGRRREDDSNIVSALGASPGGADDNDARAGKCVTAQLVFRKSRRASSPEDDETWVADGRANTLNSFDVGERDTHAVVVPISSDAASGRTGEATTPSADAKGRVRLRDPSLGVGAEGDPSFAIQAGATPAVAFTVNAAESCAKKSHARESETARCLDGTGGFASGQGGTVVAFAQNQRGEVRDLGDCAGAVREEGTNERTRVLGFHVTQDPISGDVAPCMGQGNKQGCGTIGVAIGFPTTFSNQGVEEEMSPTMNTRTMGVARATGVRRLTPRECERLQGFPDVSVHVTIVVCSGRPKSDAIAGLRSLRSRPGAWTVADDGSTLHVPSAGDPSATFLPDLGWPVAVRALIDSEHEEARLLSLGRSPSSAAIADPFDSCLPRTATDAFARAAALLGTSAEAAIRAGRAASPRSMTPSTVGASGASIVLVSGREIEGRAADAASDLRTAEIRLRSITSQHGPTSPIFGSLLTTLSCCVVRAIGGFIPSATRSGNFYALEIETRHGYTLVPYRGKPAKDGPRYQALGNSMAVPVMSWIGRRIAAVEALRAPFAPRGGG